MKHRQTFFAFGGLFALSFLFSLLTKTKTEYASQPPVVLFPSAADVPGSRAPVSQGPLTAEDPAAIQRVIEQQMSAFQADDAETAFSLASPTIRQHFQTADQFMAMVRSQYSPVYRPQSVTFEALEVVQGRPVQAVTLMGPAGEWVTAYYQMEQQQDKTWRIAGCILVPLQGETI